MDMGESSTPSTAPSGPATTESKTPEDTITLNVGGRDITTLRSTLERSDYFAKMLRGLWKETGPDHVHFVDEDPDIFIHLLRYMRHGLAPLFYDVSEGHDHSKYANVQKSAVLFGLGRLAKWLGDEEYREIVKTKHAVRAYYLPDEMPEDWTVPGSEVEYCCYREKGVLLQISKSYIAAKNKLWIGFESGIESLVKSEDGCGK
ncbi:hypothetical protein K490DRAFT_66919 [Saccharata proteae CBS 121410]|uniref:BTB domain-containing protein n=1 Tax=Saccharata proteae CBS 121410 TaxID=1314787 RepID=A0A9P4HR25_9PEZI|nr:hypothetical protein K490DRAFT_66919 [Saccharata proteae CBS 121410]